MKLQLLVEVTKVELNEKAGVSKSGKNAGKPYSIREQNVWASMGKEYPVAMTVRLEDGDPPYQPGKYVITEECLYIDRYGALAVGRVRLQKVGAQVQRPAA